MSDWQTCLHFKKLPSAQYVTCGSATWISTWLFMVQWCVCKLWKTGRRRRTLHARLVVKFTLPSPTFTNTPGSFYLPSAVAKSRKSPIHSSRWLSIWRSEEASSQRCKMVIRLVSAIINSLYRYMALPLTRIIKRSRLTKFIRQWSQV